MVFPSLIMQKPYIVFAHDGFSLELKISGCGKAEIRDCTVCLQAKGGKVSYVDNGADMAARRLYW